MDAADPRPYRGPRPPPGFAAAPPPGSRLALPAPPAKLNPGRDLTRDVRRRDARLDEVLNCAERPSAIDHRRLAVVGQDHDRGVTRKPLVERRQDLEPASVGEQQV